MISACQGRTLTEGPTLANTQDMPARNIIKTYVENGYYHIYNRGVEKRKIFLDTQDCKVFIYYLKLYLSPKDQIQKLEGKLPLRIGKIIAKNLSEEIDLLSLALMPNHVHLEVKQYTKDGIQKLMQRICTAYVMYFNRKYKRVGSLFQNKYKGILVENDTYLLWLSRYIHRNPMQLSQQEINFLQFSSYPYYLGLKSASWIKPEEILAFFKSRKDILGSDTYKQFVENIEENDQEFLGEITLEDDDVEVRP